MSTPATAATTLPPEEVLRFGRERALVGVLTPPATLRADRPAVILMNAGLVHHVGPNRIWVRAARELAAAGYLALRIDFSGIGDSPARGDNVPFEKSAVEEARAAMDALRDARGVASFVLLGLCSGAEIAFKVACADERVSTAILVNSPRYMDEPSDALIASLEKKQAARYYWSVALKNPASWLKALRGGVDFKSIAQSLASRFRGSSAPPAAASGAPNRDAESFRKLSARDAKLLLILSEGDWGFDYVHAILGSELEQLIARGSVRMEVIPSCDHMLTPLASQERTLAVLREWAKSRSAAAAR